jgi:hypothetical protein
VPPPPTPPLFEPDDPAPVPELPPAVVAPLSSSSPSNTWPPQPDAWQTMPEATAITAKRMTPENARDPALDMEPTTRGRSTSTERMRPGVS